MTQLPEFSEEFHRSSWIRGLRLVRGFTGASGWVAGGRGGVTDAPLHTLAHLVQSTVL